MARETSQLAQPPVTEPPGFFMERVLAPIEGSLVFVAARRLRRDPLGQTERKRVVASLFHEGVRRIPFLHRFYSLMTLSVLIAVLGVLADSTAVVIGAMLVAPLMAPVLGVSAALVMDWPGRAMRSGWVAITGSSHGHCTRSIGVLAPSGRSASAAG